MNGRRFQRNGLVQLLAGLLAVGLVGRTTTADAAEDDAAARPNIVLCMADDQGWGDVGYNGHPVLKTPVLDEMAESAFRFDRFYAAAPVCSPTRGSVLTGRHPNRFGCFKWGHTLRPQEITVAEALKQAGYATGHFGKWHLGPVRAESPVSPGHSGFDEWFSSPNFYENSPLMSHNGTVEETEGEGSHVTVETALEFIREAAERDQPFLAVVWFGSPHTPHVATEEYREMYKDQPPKLQNYYGEITAMDHSVGVLRRELRDLGLGENTLLWYTSDNGARQPGSTGGLRGQKGSLWEGGLAVPAIIEWPAGLPEPASTDVRCSTVDIYPTLLEIAGVSVPDQPRPLDGVSLVPLLEGRTESRSKPLGFWEYPERGRPVRSRKLLRRLAEEQADGRSPESEDAPQPWEITQHYSEEDRPGHAAWIDGGYKLHRLAKKSGDVEYRLFDLDEDPRETTDLVERQPERAERMKDALEQWQRSVIRSLNGEDYPGDG